MKSFRNHIPSLIFLLAVAANSSAQNSFQHSGQAITHSLQALGDGMVAGTKLVFGVAAVPLKVIGAVGELSGQMGDSLWEAANAPVGAPLPVTDDVISVGPSPGDAMKR